MKILSIILFAICLNAGLNAQQVDPEYDKALADSLGADEYGMKSYIFVILKTGSYNPVDKEERSRLFEGHFKNINRLAEEGRLVVAGPFYENEKGYRGIFILNVKTVEEAKELLENDPTVKSGVFDTEIFQWYGSAALPTYLEIHRKIEKEKI